MSTSSEGETEGGQNGPSESVESGLDAVSKITNHLAQTAVRASGELVPNAQFQMALRSAEDRPEILEGLILELCPSWVNRDAWKAWLDGGKSPFVSKTNKPGHASENPAQTLQRKTKAIVTQEKKVAAAQAVFETSQRNLEAAQKNLDFVKAFESAALQWHVVDQLVEIMSPAFAMGPAWTIMRAVSAHVSDEQADKATDIFFGAEKVDEVALYRKIRARETSEMFDALDWFSGHHAFEDAIRAAVMKVCKDFEPRRDEAASDGRRPRSEKAMKTMAHPKAQKDADEIIEGLPVA
jgi:hypothetical protein